jgi:hypothetical protein
MTYSSRRAPLRYELSTSARQATRAIVARVDYPKLESALLKDVDDTYYYGAQCRQCGRAFPPFVAETSCPFGQSVSAGEAARAITLREMPIACDRDYGPDAEPANR